VIKFSRDWHFQNAGEVPPIFTPPAGILFGERSQPHALKIRGNRLQIA
jgi:hypothetical protein